ncbi:hypothetical protein ASZ90_009444 [hydrocarbon metagenome]|uniref:Uncharacterized protein n=1 Tax=hydrocarbon metagenome TaxID=938273 RepID=A0A0W8FIY5_9ZZZZ
MKGRSSAGTLIPVVPACCAARGREGMVVRCMPGRGRPPPRSPPP